MKNHLNLEKNREGSSEKTLEKTLEKFIVFNVAHHHFALPITHVLRVINDSTDTYQELRAMGMIQIGRYMIRFLDLFQQLNLTGSSEGRSLSSVSPSFLIISRDAQGEVYAIPADAPPDLIEFSPDLIQPLPTRNRPNIPERVSHVVVLPGAQATTTVFLLNMN